VTGLSLSVVALGWAALGAGALAFALAVAASSAAAERPTPTPHTLGGSPGSFRRSPVAARDEPGSPRHGRHPGAGEHSTPTRPLPAWPAEAVMRHLVAFVSAAGAGTPLPFDGLCADDEVSTGALIDAMCVALVRVFADCERLGGRGIDEWTYFAGLELELWPNRQENQ
jgi:hypothetical protein